MRTIGFILLMGMTTLAAAGEFENLLQRELDPLGEGERAAVADFLGEPLLCLVIWDSRCPDSLENVAQLGEAEPPEGVGLLGINFDDVPWDAEDFLAAHRPRFPQLHDPEARMAHALGVEDYSFSFALLDSEAVIKAIHYDSVDDAPRVLREAVVAIRAAKIDRKIIPADAATSGRITMKVAEAPEDSKLAQTSRRYPVITGSGQVRTRALSVSVWGDEPESDCDCSVAGPYGESLIIQKNLLYRFSYELTAELAPGVRAGGKLRISNEDPILLEQGPEYLGNPLGSAFAELHRGRLAARAGYFSESFTPLTLQRWDFADNPPAAGSGGAVCGVCGSALRGVSLEALDDLGPGITFEGLHLETSLLSGLRVTGFYAIPQRAIASSGTTIDNPFAYRLDLLGLRLRYTFAVFGRGGGELALQHLSAHEDGESSVLPPSWSHLPMSFIHKNEVWSGVISIPLPAELEFHGEGVHSFERIDSLDSFGQGLTDKAYLMEISRRPRPGWGVSAAWQKLGPDFSSPFRALSYQSNLEGLRLSAEWRGRRFGLAAFFKDLQRVDSEFGAEAPDRSRVISGLIGWKPGEKLSFDFVGVLVREERDKVENCRCDRKTLTLTARQGFGPRTELQADVSFLAAESADQNDPPRAVSATLQFTADF